MINEHSSSKCSCLQENIQTWGKNSGRTMHCKVDILSYTFVVPFSPSPPFRSLRLLHHLGKLDFSFSSVSTEAGHEPFSYFFSPAKFAAVPSNLKLLFICAIYRLAECLLIAQDSFLSPPMPHCRHCDREFVDDHALQQVVAPIDLHIICLR